MWWFLYILGDVSPNPPTRTDRPRGTPVRGGAPQRGGAPARGGAPVPRPKVSAATYWRRRIVVLGLGAGVLTTLSWAVNGLLATGSTTGHGATAGHTPAARHAPARHHKDQASPVASPSASPSHAPARHRASKRTHVSGNTPACTPGGVTLTVTSPQYWYQPGKMPEFTVHASAAQSQPCHFDMSPRSVSVVIDSSGGRTIWSSADCAGGSGADPVVLASGTHATLHVSWDRRTGCGDAGNLVRPGEYRVSAAAGAVHSKSVNIVLGAKGVSGP